MSYSYSTSIVDLFLKGFVAKAPLLLNSLQRVRKAKNNTCTQRTEGTKERRAAFPGCF